LTFTPDSKTLFINIQHPGERGSNGSNWPDGGTAMPRSATVIITKNDGGVIGT
jgi:secreted PhoX family phosphatase